MDNTNDKAFILIDKFHTGQASQDEVASLNRWRNASTRNAKLFEELMFLLGVIQNLKDWKQFDKKEAWSNFQGRITNRYLRIARQVAAVAAVAFFVVAAALWNFGGSDISTDEAYISGLSNNFSILDDGSEIFLEENAKVYTTNFSNESRFLRTEGSYFVNVSRNEQSPFTLETGKVSIKVLGTSFKVKESEDVTLIQVRDGSVEVTSYDGSKYNITEGQQFRLIDDKVSISRIDKKNWGLFNKSYQDETIFNVLNDLSEIYRNLKINASTVNSQCKITTTIQESTVVEVLEEIDLLFDVEYEIEEGVVTIKEISC